MNKHPVLNGLNEPQQEAVRNAHGPLLVFAGAGSGKTRVLVHRIAWLIQEENVAPEAILAVTFTNKAAREMRQRCEEFIGHRGRDVWISTFHSACNRILRTWADALDMNPNFTILDSTEQLDLLKQVMRDLDIDPDKHKPRAVHAQIERAKQRYQGPENFYNQVNFTGLPFGQLYQAYQDRLKAVDALDFGDLMFYCVRLFENKPEILATYHQQLSHFLIDEYQDTNAIQFRWINLLARAKNNLCVVGDDDQSIYSWRGADTSNIRNFRTTFKEAREVKLEQNYRSTKTILEGAYSVIKHNKHRTAKKLWTDGDTGGRIRVHSCTDEQDEAHHAITWLLEGVPENQYKNLAVFYRTNAQSRSLEEACIKKRIPYRVYGGLSFYARKEIKDVLAYLRLLVNGRDFPALARIINTPRRGIGKTSTDRLQTLSEDCDGDCWQALARAARGDLVGNAAGRKIGMFLTKMQTLADAGKQLSIMELTSEVLEKTGYLDALKSEGSEESKNRIENLDELLTAMATFEEQNEDRSLSAYLQSVSLLSDLDREQSEEGVTLMTMHMAKGLEFDRVAIVGVEEDLFPSARSLAEDPVNGVEEERRLCYVGMTRARKKLALYHVQMRRVWGAPRIALPSRFVDEIPEELVEQVQAKRHTDYRRPRSQVSYPAKQKVVTRKPAVPAGGPDEIDGWKKGGKIRHPSLGNGTIVALESSGAGPKLHIRFSSGTRIILPKYVKLTQTG